MFWWVSEPEPTFGFHMYIAERRSLVGSRYRYALVSAAIQPGCEYRSGMNAMAARSTRCDRAAGRSPTPGAAPSAAVSSIVGVCSVTGLPSVGQGPFDLEDPSRHIAAMTHACQRRTSQPRPSVAAMPTVGVIGGIGCGKSTVTALLADKGAVV